MSKTQAIPPRLRFVDTATGRALVDGKVYTYVAGTVTPTTTWTDSTGNTANTNPIILDERGEADIWLGDGLYKFILQDSAGNQIDVTDNISNNSLATMQGATGSANVGHTPAGADVVATTVKKKFDRIVELEDFYVEGETDHTVAFARLATRVAGLTNGVTVHLRKANYTLAFASGAKIAAAFSGINGLTIIGAPSTITATQTTPNSSSLTIFDFTSCLNVRIAYIGLIAEDMASSGPSSAAGQRLFKCNDENRNIIIENCWQQYGLAIGQITSTAGSTSRTTNVHLKGTTYVDAATYGLNCQWNGDNVVVDNLVTKGVYRSYFIYGCKHHKAFIRSEGARHDDVILAGLDGQGLDDIDITICQAGASSVSGATQVLMSIQYGPTTTTAVAMNNIRIRQMAKIGAATGYLYGFRLKKADADGNTDTTDRGHVVNNVVVSQDFVSANASFIPFLVGDGGVGGTWGSGENISNFVMRDCSTPSTVASSYFTPGAADKGGCGLDSVYMPLGTILASGDATPMPLTAVTANVLTEGNPSSLIYTGCTIGGTRVPDRVRFVGLGATYDINQSTGAVTNTHGSTGAGFSAVLTAPGYAGDGVIRAQATNASTTGGAYYFFSASVTGSGTYRFVVDNRGDVVNTNNSYGAISDARLKTKVVDATPKLADIMQVKVRNYELLAQPGLKQIGVLDTELEQVFPGLVDAIPDRDANGVPTGTFTRYVKYSVLIPILLKAVQELNAKVDALA